MPHRTYPPPDPATLAAALAAIDVTRSPADQFSATEAAAHWAMAKAARGQSVDLPRLKSTHLIGQPAPGQDGGTVAAIDAARARVSARIRAMLTNRHPDLDGAA